MGGARWRLIVLSVAALGVFYVVDTGIYRLTIASAPWLARLADLRLTSLAAIALTFAMSARMPLRPSMPPRATLALAALWLLGTFASIHAFGIGKIPLPRWEDRVAFLLTGSMGEELLCRGLVLFAALRVWPEPTRPRTALVWSAVVFSLLHLQYHGFRVGPSALQMLWTLPEGYVFGLVALRTRSVTASWIVHALNNAIVVLA